MITKLRAQISKAMEEYDYHREDVLASNDALDDLLSGLTNHDGRQIRNLKITTGKISFDEEAIFEGGYWGHRIVFEGPEDEMALLVCAAHSLRWVDDDKDLWKRRRIEKKSIWRAVLSALELNGKENANAAEKLSDWRTIFIAKRLADSTNIPFTNSAELLSGPREWIKERITTLALVWGIRDIDAIKLAMEIRSEEEFRAALDLWDDNPETPFQEIVALAK